MNTMDQIARDIREGTFPRKSMATLLEEIDDLLGLRDNGDEAAGYQAFILMRKVLPELRAGRTAGLEEAMEAVQALRHKIAATFTPEASGQRGQDKTDILHDAYHAIRALKSPPTSPTGSTEKA